ncbi:MAG: hypothetical protein ACJA16_004340 [Akkermansiaceae bacterium]|jgi:hypothetical protein
MVIGVGVEGKIGGTCWTGSSQNQEFKKEMNSARWQMKPHCL